MSDLFTKDPAQRDKLRQELSRAAFKMKTGVEFIGRSGPITIGFAFNDGVVQITMDSEFIRQSTHFQLTDTLYNEIVGAISPKH